MSDISIYLKPSGRPYYISFFVLFLALCALLYLIGTFVPQVNVYIIMFGLLILYFIASGIAFLYFQQIYMHVEDDTVSVKMGILTSKFSLIPFGKITEVSTQYGIVDRILGLGSVTIEMMGGEADDITFKNIPKDSISAFMGVFKRSRDGKPAAPQPPSEKPPQKPESDRW